MLTGTSTMPNPLLPDDQKDLPSFGLKLMTGAYNKWNTGYNGETRSGRKARFDYNRAFAMGKQPMDEYKDRLDLDGELSVVNLDYSPLPIAIPFLNRLKDRYNQRIEKISCNSIDPYVTDKKKKAKDNALFKLREKLRIMQLQQQSGVPIENFSDNDPQSEEEVNVEFGYNYKEEEEIMMQELITLVMYENDFDGVIKDRLMDDLINCGYAGVKVFIDATGRIKIRFIKPENLITSYTEWNDFRDWQWIGEAFYMSIADIRLKYPGKVSEEKLFELAQNAKGKFGNPADFSYGWDAAYTTALARPYDSWRVEVIELDFKTLYNLKYKVGQDRFGKETLDRISRVTDPEKTLQSNPYYVQYTGVMIAETEYVLEWGLSKNMIKPSQNLQEIYSSYAVYMYGNNQMVNTPLIETMIPTIKMMQLIDLQQQKIIAAAMPDGYDVDISTMSDVDIGLGEGTLSPYDLYKIKKQTGIGFYKRLEDDGKGQRREPITANNVPFSGKLEQLMAKWNQGWDTLYRIIGSNSLDAGEIRNQGTGAQVLHDAQKMGESASNYIYNSYINIKQRAAKLVQLRGWDILVFGKTNSYDGYRRALGANNIEYIKINATDDFEKTNFDVLIKVVNDDSEQQFLEQNIAQALSQNEIQLNDAIDVRRLAEIDVVYASYMLAARINRRKKELEQQARQNSIDNTQSAIAAAKAKSDGEMQLEQLKADNKAKEMAAQLENSKEIEILKFVGIAKAKIIEGILNDPTKTWKDIPQFVWDGLGIVDQTQKQIMVNAIHEMQDQEAAEAQAQQQAQLQAEQQQQQPPPQEQQAA
jgi:hypothetical protein